MNLSDKTDKEIAILVSKRLGTYDPVMASLLDREDDFSDYLENIAGKILFSEGMAGKIYQHLVYKERFNNSGFIAWFNDISPRKILEVWIEGDL